MILLGFKVIVFKELPNWDLWVIPERHETHYNGWALEHRIKKGRLSVAEAKLVVLLEILRKQG